MAMLLAYVIVNGKSYLNVLILRVIFMFLLKKEARDFSPAPIALPPQDQKRPERRTEIDRKNYVNYIDYQEAKARSEQNRNKFVSIIGTDSANNTGASKSKAKYINDKAVTTDNTTIKKDSPIVIDKRKEVQII